MAKRVRRIRLSQVLPQRYSDRGPRLQRSYITVQIGIIRSRRAGLWRVALEAGPTNGIPKTYNKGPHLASLASRGRCGERSGRRFVTSNARASQMAGIGFGLAVAALALSLRSAHKLRKLADKRRLSCGRLNARKAAESFSQKWC
jgi:hypothetical protein